MRVAIAVTVFSALAVGSAYAQKPTPTGPREAKVVVNSQKSLADAIGDGFIDEAWAYPADLLPSDFPGLKYVSGPTKAGLGKGAWRTPVVLRDPASGAEIVVDCFRQMDASKREAMQVKPGAVGTPWLPLTEPAYQYKAAIFHDLRAATATEGDRHVFAFRDGDILYKIEAAGGKAESRRDGARAAAEAIWKFLHVPTNVQAPAATH